MSRSERALERLDRLRALLELEERESREAERERLLGKSVRVLEEDGVLARRLTVRDEVPALFGRFRIELGEDPTRKGHLSRFAARAGDVVRLSTSGAGPDGEGPSGILVRASRDRLSVIIDESEWAAEGTVDVRTARDEVTLRRLYDGLGAAKAATGRSGALIEIVLGAADPRLTGDASQLALLDERLNEDQRRALQHALFAPDVALVHGPFGTGKTRVLVEVVRQAVLRGERVLCLAASNAAVDHLAISLLAEDPELRLLRTGHPARADARLEGHTLAALSDASDKRKIARGLVEQALRLKRSTERRSERGRRHRDEDRAARAEARGMFADARALERQASAEVIARARIIAGTLTGHMTELPDELRFDLLVVDEASQALTPALLLGLLRADRLVLAGDHRQLPPTVISPGAARGGLSATAFEALMEHPSGPGFSHMLTVQHRMHAELMRFPSERFYGGRLVAHESVAAETLASRAAPIAESALFRVEVPLEVIDTAGAGMAERAEDEGESKENPAEAALIARPVRALIASGLGPSEIGVIAPYSAQVATLRRALEAELALGLEIDSVDGFQGREKEVILFDAVRSNELGEVGFLSDQRRLNVAITRARRKLILVGDSATLSSDPLWADYFEEATRSPAYRSSFELPEGGELG